MIASSPPPAFDTHRPRRSVEPPESPFPGTIAHADDGSAVYLVDRTLVSDLLGWAAAEDAHVFAPLDVVRRPDGHDVVFPVLTEAVADFLQRRHDAGAPLAPGEAVTLAVSVLRGLASSASRLDDSSGEWWLADDGRPLLVEGVGKGSIRETSAHLLRTIAEDCPRTRLGSALHQIADAAERPDFVRADADAEDRLFGCADPEPLITEVFGPRRARTLAAEPEPVEQAAPDNLWRRLAFHVDADLAAVASDAITALLRRIRRPVSRTRPVLAAAAIALIIVAGGLLWPHGTDDPVATAHTLPTEHTESGDESEPDDAIEQGDPTDHSIDTSPGQPEPVADDLVGIADDLLDRRLSCSDTACLATVLEDPVRTLPRGVIDDPSEDRRATLLDDLGGLVVVRIDSLIDRPMQLMTAVDTEDGWRIRDVHDVTDAPS